ncbi:MAG: hypothetical protein F4081_01255, partial [Dehalococcoidia bacterium]|nr:hypothetical protein [Dehalococcoidia bacterium]
MDVEVGGGAQGEPGAVAVDGEPLEEQPLPGNGLGREHLLLEPLVVAIGAGRLRRECHHAAGRRHPDGGGEEGVAHAPPERTDVDAMTRAALPPAAEEPFAETAMGAERFAP